MGPLGYTWLYLAGQDALNSMRQETDDDGRVLKEQRFDRYGVPIRSG
jgi:hypothetical protein